MKPPLHLFGDEKVRYNLLENQRVIAVICLIKSNFTITHVENNEVLIV